MLLCPLAPARRAVRLMTDLARGVIMGSCACQRHVGSLERGWTSLAARK